MGLIKILTVSGAVLTLLAAVAIGVGWHFLSLPTVPPTLPVQYWGPEEAKPDNPAIISFKINISSDIIEDLYDRLEHLPPLTPPLEGANFQYGFNADYLQKVVQFWLKEYKWKEREAFLNKLPHFRTQVSGLDVHFIHVKPSKVPEGVKVFPLLMMHGWPSSVRDFYEIVPLLTTPRAQEKFVFEVIVPSLPGHGFSDGASKQGLGAAQIAVVMKSLMNRLGFKKFYIQGGDWGAIIASHIGVLFPDSVLGIHSNMCFSNSPLTIVKEMISHLWPSLFYNEDEILHVRSFGERLPFILEETGYMHLQATKPDTIGTALSDSPAGLAAYILEKFSTWTNPDWRSLPDGGLTQKYTLTNLLDNIMIYWVTDTITSSLRLYSETFSRAQLSLDLDRAQCLVPTACAIFPNTLRIQYQPEFLLRDKFPNLVQVSNIPRGGHFPAFEEPGLLSDDIWSAVAKMIKHSDHYMPK